MILYRCFAWDERAGHAQQDGPLWFPRIFQGEGRHDNPAVYGCLYLADCALSCIVEQIARFRGQRLSAPLLRRRGLPLALAELELADGAQLIDFDDPTVLKREGLRPSLVATRNREITQPQALALYQQRATIAGLRWWSSFEALWINVTLFDRAGPQLSVRAVRVLTLDDQAILEAAQFFGARIVA
jgi:hypothetical protein